MLPFVSFIAVISLAVIAWLLYRRFGTDAVATLMERRRTTSRFVSRGMFVDGQRHVAVALALDRSTFFYENRNIQGSVDLQWVSKIEYDNELATGKRVAGAKILRIRARRQTLEFVLPDNVVARWHTMLPQRGVAASPYYTDRYQTEIATTPVEAK